MTGSLFCLIERKAGGALCSDRTFIREALKLLTKRGRGHEFRSGRHAWLRDGLSMKRKADAQFLAINTR